MSALRPYVGVTLSNIIFIEANTILVFNTRQNENNSALEPMSKWQMVKESHTSKTSLIIKIKSTSNKIYQKREFQ